MRKTATSLLEYTLILGVVSAVFMGMNIYIKRGIQARVKDMADNFIGGEQLAGSDPTAYTDSTTGIDSQSTVKRELLLAGVMKNNIFDETHITIDSTVTTQAASSSSLPQTTSAQDGNVIAPPRPDDEEFIDSGLIAERDEQLGGFSEYGGGSGFGSDIEQLESERDRYLNQANELEKVADQIEAEGMKLIPAEISGRCNGTAHGSASWTSCIKTQWKRQYCEREGGVSNCPPLDTMTQTGIDLVEKADDSRQEAEYLREKAAQLQAQIDELKRS